MLLSQLNFDKNRLLPSRRSILIVSGCVLIWLFIIVLHILWIGFYSLRIQKNNAYSAETESSITRVKSGLRSLQFFTLNQSDDITVLIALLDTYQDAYLVLGETHQAQLSFQTEGSIELSHIKPAMRSLSEQMAIVHQIVQDGVHTPILDIVLPPNWKTILPNLHQYTVLANSILNQPGDFIIMLQNADEIRASGGFLGSYARIEIRNSRLFLPSIRDIYDPAGVFTGFIPAPKGAREYLSGGKGLRLQDSNWDAHFPTAAQTVLRFFSYGQEESAAGIIAINSRLISDILKVTGSIYIPDYDTNVHAHNFSDVARADRESFFPGSKQKEHFLNHFLSQFSLKLAQLSLPELRSLATALLMSLEQKQLLLYHQNPDIQSTIEQTNLSGSLTIPEHTELYIYPIESNVGINKANHMVDRNFVLTVAPEVSVLKINFTNRNQKPSPSLIANPFLAVADHLHYVNYQRIIVLPNMNVTSILQNGVPITNWDESLLQIGTTQLKEIGFITTTKEQSKSTIEITISHPGLLSQTTQVHIPFQPGLPPSVIQISSPREATVLEFQSNITQVISL